MSIDLAEAKAIFLRAAEQNSPAARQALLEEACGNDSTLRQHVEMLLVAHAQAGSFLEQGALAREATLDQTPLERPGAQIGPYKLLQQIGEGGMGTVYMAEQKEPIARQVALKIIKPGMDSRQVIARFEAERQALAMMDHVNIARVLDAGTIGMKDEGGRMKDEKEASDSSFRLHPSSFGRPYFVMELVHGVPITKYCDDNHLTPRERLELFVPVCQAIQHAHQKGIIHRDIKPSNVMVTLYDGKPVPKVIDFGVAKATEQKLTERTLFTQYGTMVGTLEYMSPEQAEMSALGVDTRSDIYSLGVLLYELLTGSTPLTHKRMKEAAYVEILRMIKDEEPPKPSTRLSDSGEALASISANRHTEPTKLTKLVRGELDWIVMKTLEKDRNRRYETAKDFAADVQRYLDDEQVQACPPSAWYRFRKFARRNRAALATAAVVLTALCIATIGLTISNVLVRAERNEKIQALDEKGKALGEKQTALGEKETALTQAQANFVEAKRQERLAQISADNAKQQQRLAEEQEALARRRFYAAQMNLAMQAWEAGDTARTLELLETQRPKFDQDDLRSFEWYYLWRLCHRGLRSRLNHHAGIVTSVAFFPDGKTLASTAGASIKLWDVATAQEKAQWQTGAHLGFSVSPDGKLLATWGEGDSTRVWDATSGQQVAVFEGTTAPTFSPDGMLIAVARKTDIEFWDLATRQRHAVLRRSKSDSTDNVMGLGSFVFAPNAKMAIARVNETLLRIYRWDGANWQPGGEISNPAWFLPVAFSPDSKTFAVGGNVLKLYAADTDKELSTPIGHTGIVHSVAFSPDGKSLASAGGDRTVRVWDLATGRQQTSYPHPGPVFSVAYSPDGKKLASAGSYGTLRLWDTAPAEPASVLQRSANGIAFFPDGNTLAAAGTGITLWDVATGKQAATFGNADYGLLALSHDGNRLAVTQPNGSDVQLWDLATRQEYAVLAGHSHRIHSLAFSPDDKTLATASYDGTVRLWDIAARETRLTLKPGKPTSAVAFSPDGQTMATGSQSENVQLWDVATGRALATLQEVDRQGAGPWCWAVAFSPDGKTLAAASQTGLVRLWDTATARLRASLQGHTAAVRCVAFSPDGTTVGTGSDDRTVRLWDTATGQEKVTLKAHTAGVILVAFSRDGGTLATASWDGSVRLWRASQEPEAKAFRTELDPDEPDSPAALRDAADRLKTAGRAAEAQQVYEKASARLEKLAVAHPSRSLYRKEMGGLYKELGQWDKAAAEYTKAIELKPDDWEVWSSRAFLHFRRQQWDLAISDFSKAIDLTPHVHTNWWHRGHSYLQLAEWDKAAADFGKVVDQWPDAAEGWYRRGIAFAQLNQPDKAIADLRQAIAKGFKDVAMMKNDPKLEPLRSHEDFKTLLNEVEQNEKQKRDDAIAALRKTIKLDPSDAKAHAELGAALRAQGKLDEAIACFRKTIELDPKHGTAYTALGYALKAQGKSDEATTAFQKAIEFDANPRATHTNLAWWLATDANPKFRDPKAAVTHARKALDLAPEDPNHWSNLGVALWRAGDLKTAVETLEKADRMYKDGDHFHRFFLAMGYWQVGKKDKARHAYDQAVEWMDKNQPKNEELRRFRTEAAELLGVKEKLK